MCYILEWKGSIPYFNTSDMGIGICLQDFGNSVFQACENFRGNLIGT